MGNKHPQNPATICSVLDDDRYLAELRKENARWRRQCRALEAEVEQLKASIEDGQSRIYDLQGELAEPRGRT